MPVVVRLPRELRDELKEPMGRVYTDPEGLLAAVDGPLIAVGDVVTYHLRRASRVPDVAVVDGRTEREAVDSEVRTVVGLDDEFDEASETGAETRIDVSNPPAALSTELLRALREAVDAAGAVTIVVDGEEDLATLPAILVAPGGASVVYGQPGEGMVHVVVDPETRATARELFGRLEGDTAAALDALGVRR